MEGIRSQRERMDMPFGMSELDLLTYSPTLYEMYRNEGQGYGKEGFRWDPIVSRGMLASDYAYAAGMQWMNILTPESQMAIDPGDGLIVPVETYDDYRQNLPVEKYLTTDVSFTGGKTKNNRNDINRMNRINPNSFVGDFTKYFDNESRMFLAESAQTMPVGPVAEVGGSASIQPGPLVEAGIVTIGPIGVNPAPTTPKYRCINTAPWCVRDDVNGNKTSCNTCPSGVSVSVGTGTGEGNPTPQPCYYNYGQWSPCVNGVQTRSATSSPSNCVAGVVGPNVQQACMTAVVEGGGSGGLVGTGSGSGAGSGGGSMGGGEEEGGSMGGGSMGGGGSSAGEEAGGSEAGEAKGGSATPANKTECKMNYTPVIIGAIAGLAVGYFYAKNKNKDIKMFSAVIAIVGAILGYAYAKHQCSPIDVLTKLKVPSKAK